jgi:UDP:flavonoid glycosyltransferase YjiC (YdhE family)
VVFTLGTSAVGAAGRFYHESAAAAQKLGMRAVLLTGGIAQNEPRGLPDSVLPVARAPHQLLFPRAAAVVHQVGAGTLGQALRSGKPMLLVPHAHDQFDNASRAMKLGLARTLFPKQYTAERVARELTWLLGANPRRRAEEAATVVRQEGGAEAAAAAIEALLA